MGRYYSGDIEGKFWFGVQSSDAASQFGAEPSEPQVLYYNFDSAEHLESVQKRIAELEDKLKNYEKQLDMFFENHSGYNDEMLVETLKISKIKVKQLLIEYADLQLGKEIEKSLLEYGYCNFEAEL